MKNSKIYFLLGTLCLLLQSCLFDEEDVFDDSSAQRAMASVRECQEVLESASNGWLLEYYPGEGPEFGGYNLLARFDGEQVELASEVATANYNVGEVSTSFYKIVAYQSTELSFDSYNEIIHTFCEPSGYNDLGYAGDYEFIFNELTPERVVLTGKKHGNKLVMTPMPIGQDWAKFLTNIAKLQQKAPFATFKLKVAGKEVSTVFRSNHTWQVTELDLQGEKVTTSFPFIYTEEGIKLLNPIEVNGIAISQLRWNEEQREYVCTDDGADATFEFYCPEKYADYIGMYYLVAGEQSVIAQIEPKVEGTSYILSGFTRLGLPDYKMELTYNLENDCFDILSQYLGDYEQYQVYLCPWDTEGGYLTWSSGSGLSGKVTSKEGEKLKIEFVDNGVFGVGNSLLFYAFNGAPSGTTMAGSILQLPQPILIKLF